MTPVEKDQESDVLVEEKPPEIAEPPQYGVFLHNDDYTTMEFVIEVLQKFFKKTGAEAEKIMMKVHHEGKGLAGIYSSEIAETKVAQVTQYARAKGFPLRCTAEPLESGK